MQKKLKDSSFKGALISGVNELFIINEENKKEYFSGVCKERLMGISVVMFFRKHFFLAPEINKVIGDLISAGLINRIHSNYLDKELLDPKVRNKPPKIMNLSHILGCFQLLASGYFFSFVCFLLEMLAKKFKMRFRRIFVEKRVGISCTRKFCN